MKKIRKTNLTDAEAKEESDRLLEKRYDVVIRENQKGLWELLASPVLSSRQPIFRVFIYKKERR